MSYESARESARVSLTVVQISKRGHWQIWSRDHMWGKTHSKLVVIGYLLGPEASITTPQRLGTWARHICFLLSSTTSRCRVMGQGLLSLYHTHAYTLGKLRNRIHNIVQIDCCLLTFFQYGHSLPQEAAAPRNTVPEWRQQTQLCHLYARSTTI